MKFHRLSYEIYKKQHNPLTHRINSLKNIIELPFIKVLQNNLKKNPHLLQVILGPRQIGKTTTLGKYLKSSFQGDYIYESADKVFNSNESWLLELWTRSLKEKKTLIIDEIQKCENWSEIIKVLWDKKQKNGEQLTCILLGSSSLSIQKGLTESLTGRFQQINAYHWNFEESKRGYNLSFDDYLKFGGYPGSYTMMKDSDWANYVKNSIINTVIEKDILQNSRVKSPSLFRQAFELLCSYPCHEISYTKLLGQIQDKGNVDLIKHYINLYEGAFLIKSLEKFSLNKIKLKKSSPKILALAPALYYLTVLDDYTAKEQGFVFEALVGSQLVRTGIPLYYWREGNHEVDFVLQQGRKIWGVEVKSGRNKKAKSMIKFLEKHPNAEPVYIDKDNYFEFEKHPIKFLSAK